MARVAIPNKPEELAEMLADSSRMAELFENGRPKPEFGEFVAAYVKATKSDSEGETSRQIQAEVQRGLRDFLRENKPQEGTVPVNLAPGDPRMNARNGLFSNRAPGAKIDNEKMFKDVEDYLRATWYRNTDPEAIRAQEALRSIRNAFGSTVPADGGFLIPETLRSSLLQVALETAIVRPRATIIPMESLRVPIPTIDSTTNSGSVHGGMVGYWTEESGALTASQARFGRVVLEAKKLTGYSEVPNELFADAAVSFAALLQRLWPEAIAFFEDLAFFDGTGVGEPLGFLRAKSTIAVPAESGQTSGIVWENIVNMFARMLPSSLGRAVWVAAIDTFPELATMALNVGTGGAPVWLTNGADTAPMSILGRPVIFTEKAKALNTKGDLSFVDFSYFLVGDRQAMQMETSPHYRFANDQTAVRIIERVDGRPWLESAITPANGSSNTLSPFVTIETRTP